MTTIEAFKMMLEDPVIKQIFNKNTIDTWKKRMRDNGKINQQSMEDALRKSGLFAEDFVNWELFAQKQKTSF